MEEGEKSNYYISRKEKMLDTFNKVKEKTIAILEKQFDSDFAQTVFAEAEKLFGKVLPDLPYIGGKKNPYTQVIILGGISLSVYAALRILLRSKKIAQQLTFAIVHFYLKDRPKIPAKETSAWIFSNIRKSRITVAEEEPNLPDAGDEPPLDFVEEEGRDFDLDLPHLDISSGT